MAHTGWHSRGQHKKIVTTAARLSGKIALFQIRLDAGVRYNFRSGSSVTAMSHLRQGDYKDRQFFAGSVFDNAYDEQGGWKLGWIGFYQVNHV